MGLDMTAVGRHALVGSNPTPGAYDKPAWFLGSLGLWLKKQGFKDGTITPMLSHLRILGNKVNLDNPELVKETIAVHPWSDGFKRNLSYGYQHYAKWRGLQFERLNYKPVDKLPFIPTEAEMDSLIHSCGFKTGTVLQLLKETGARIGEAWRLRWTDLDFERGIVTITPEKGSYSRQLKISPKLCTMLSRLPRKGLRVFERNMDNFRREYEKQRRRRALRLGNPRLQQIKLHTFRHFKATMEYHKTKDILHVQRILGHRNIMHTLRYTQLVDWKSEDFVCKTAMSIEEASSLIEAGFDYVTELDNVKLFRKRK